MSPLAYRIRPTSFKDVIGQKLLCGDNGILTNMIKNKSFYSFVLYGRPGSGKTTIASIFAKSFSFSFKFNAALDTKQTLKDIITNNKLFYPILLIVDEIHRMNKDVQDYLLPFTESGDVILLGLTTENPYIALTPQLRSRLFIYKLNEIDSNTLINYLKDVSFKEFNKVLDDDIYKYIADVSNLEIRTSLNILDIAHNIKDVSVLSLSRCIGLKSVDLDSNGNNYYDLLSALIKSIRGSDVDAALYYVARFLESGDLVMLKRRLLISVYEDIGLANPFIGGQVKAALDSAMEVGLPEARIMIGFVVVLLATSPKSNSTYLAINSAIDFVKNNKDYKIPPYILNREIKGGAKYLYPHDYKGNFVKQQYLPNDIKDICFYKKCSNKYEDKLDLYYADIRKCLKS